MQEKNVKSFLQGAYGILWGPIFFEILLLIVIFYYIMNLCRGGSNEENGI